MLRESVALGFASVGAVMLAQPWTYADDFHAFLCAGGLLAHRLPQDLAGMQRCELFGSRIGPVVPAPLPGYALLAFAPLAALPYAVALTIFTLALAAATVATIRIMGRWMQAPLAAVAVPFLVGDLLISARLGQPMPLVVLALVATADALAARRSLVAAGIALAMLLEPQIGAPVVVALALALPRTRVPLAAGIVALGALWLAFAGSAGMLAYVGILHAHALAELPNSAQDSLSHALWLAGVSPTAALSAGAFQYLLTAAAGIAIGSAVARRRGDLRFAVLVPAACTVLGGTFVHAQQIAVAMPLAFLLTLRSSGGRTNAAVAALAIVALAVDTGPPIFGPPVITVDAIVAGVVTWWYLGRLRKRSVSATRAEWGGAAVAFAACIAIGLVARFQTHTGYLDWRAFAATATNSGLEDEWAAFIRATHAKDAALAFASATLPKWAALLYCILATSRLLRDPQSPASPTEEWHESLLRGR